MTNEMKRELITCVQYFVIALIAEVGTFLVLIFRSCDGCQYSLAMAWRNMESPRLWPWFVIFLTLSAGRILIFYITSHYKQNHLE